MSTGVEAIETSIKFARKWAYKVKKVTEAHILFCDKNFHGRTTAIISASDDPLRKDQFGPYECGFSRIPFNNIKALKDKLE